MALPTRPRFNRDDEESNNKQSYSESALPTPASLPRTTPETNYANDLDPEPWESAVESVGGGAIDYVEEDEPSYIETTPFATDEELEDDGEELDPELSGLPEDVVDSLDRLMEEIISDDSSEVLMNGPQEIHYKKNGIRYHIPEINFRDVKTYHHIINKFVLEFTDTKDRIGEDSFFIEGQLELEDPRDSNLPPTVARVHVMAPPVVKFAKVTIAKKAKNPFTIDEIANRGSMTLQMAEFMKAIARGKVTTILSGVSGSGKTTLLEALSFHFDQNDRIIVVEDTPELNLPVTDVVYMASTKPKPGEDKSKATTLEWLVSQTNRMRPDRIIIGESRGGEFAEFLLAANSGADGSMTTIHASDPRRALNKMAALAAKAGTGQDERSINKDISSTVQLIIQAAKIDGQHVITHIEEVSNTIREQTGAISTTTLFEYDRYTGAHVAKNQPSEQLKKFLAARGVNVELGWFRN
jgi:pilus assembly protein CpaF